jgi:hypothetical protein
MTEISELHSCTFKNSKIYTINHSHILLHTNIETTQNHNSLIDLTTKRTNKCKIILSSMQYNKFKNLQFVNNNLNDVNFYSYLGGKEITTLINNNNIFSSINYPNYTGTLFNSIEFPIIENDDEIFLLLDEYIELNNIYTLNLKINLIKTDIGTMLTNIKQYIGSKKIILNIIINSTIYDEIDKIVPYDSQNIDFINNDKSLFFSSTFIDSPYIKLNIIKVNKSIMAEYTCNMVFGKIIGNCLQDFSGNIYFPNYSIIDVYTDGQHTIFKRSSGLQISKNGKSELVVILKNNLPNTNNLTICESLTDTELENIIITDIKEYKSKNIFNKLILYIDNYEKLLFDNLNKNINEIKNYMLNNSSFINEIEFFNIEEIIIDDNDWFLHKIKNRFIELIQNFKNIWNEFRKIYFDNFISNDMLYLHNNISILRMQTNQLTDTFSNCPIPKLERNMKFFNL